MLNRKSHAPTGALLIAGLVGLMNLMRKPRFASFHNVDVLQLLASGMCFGLALAGLLAWWREPRT
ncbi:MAG: hypothetical protein ABSD20_11455 [Terriglobales bacterium]